MKVPLMTKEGGPVISLERANKPDALVVVWMSIDTTEYPIKGYLVFLNQQQCGSMVRILIQAILKKMFGIAVSRSFDPGGRKGRIFFKFFKLEE